MPSPCGIKAHSDRRWVAWKRTAPSDIERCSHLGQGECPIHETKRALRKLCGSARRLSFEGGVRGPLGKEVRVCNLEMPQGLLQWNRRYLVEKCQLGQLLPCGKRCALSRIAYRLLGRGPRFRPGVQSLVVDKAHASNRTTQESFLFRRWVESVAETSLRHAYKAPTTSVNVNPDK